MLTRRGFLKAALAAPAVILTPGLLMRIRSRVITPLFNGEVGRWSNVKLRPMQWSHDGLQWTDDEMALFKENPQPAYVFNRCWVTVEEMERRYTRLVVDTGVKSPIILAGTLRPQKT